MTDRETLRTAFDDAAELYDRARPGYPIEVIETIVAMTGIGSGSDILEVGCGTGQITIPFAERGHAILALEPGRNLARLAAANCRAFPDVRIEETTFEEWKVEEGAFDLLLSAQAFHWIDPDIGFARAGAALKNGGSIVLVWSLDRSQETPFYQATDPIYTRYFPPVKPGEPARSLSAKVDVHRERLRASEEFDAPQERCHWWERSWSGSDYLKLLNTFSDHRSLPEPDRTSFFQEIAMAIERMGDAVTRRFETVVLVARKKDQDTFRLPQRGPSIYICPP